MSKDLPAGAGSGLLGLSEEAQELLLATLDHPPGVRKKFLREATDDPAIRKTVLDMLRSFEQADEKVDRLAAKVASDLHASPLTGTGPVRAGPYRLEKELGRGGMSVVYLGRRDDGQFEQTVAVKILPTGSIIESWVKRFNAERSILARLEHPNLARFIDGGFTEEGWPYFTMEYVDGVRIDEYCDRHQLNIPQRLEVFRQVLDAVQYAHRNLVIHRDIKPSNFLVTAEGQVKLLDFGIAKVLVDAAEAGEASDLTRIGGMPMSPAWASPEQITAEPVTIASDIYSLGVLLYKLLTGHLPLHNHGQGFDTLRHAIVETPPIRPSLKVLEPVADTQASPAQVAASRHTGLRRLSRKLSGDLDNIVLMALRKEPERRYSTVEQFAADLDHYRAGRPVRARADTLAYRTTRFLARNALPVAAGVVILALAFGGLVLHNERLHQERDRAEQAALSALSATALAEQEAVKNRLVIEYLMSLFAAVDPSENRGQEMTAADLLEMGMGRIDALNDQPLVQASLMQVMARANQSLGNYEKAEQLAGEALLRLETYPEDRPVDRAVAMSLKAAALHRQDASQRAIEYHEQALRLLDDGHELERLQVLRDYGITLAGTYGRLENALQILGQVEAMSERLGHPGLHHVEALSAAGVALFSHARYEEAATAFGDAARLAGELHGIDHPVRLGALGNLAHTQAEMGNFDIAEQLFGDVIDIQRRVLGEQHPNLGKTLHSMGSLHWRQGEVESAQAWWLKARKTLLQRLPPEHPDVAAIQNALALAARELGDLEQAEVMFHEALTSLRLAYGESNLRVPMILVNLSGIRSRQGEIDEAIALLKDAKRMQINIVGEYHNHVAHVRRNIGDVYLISGDPESALPWAEKGLTTYRAVFDDPQHPGIIASLELIERIHAALNEKSGMVEAPQVSEADLPK
jgi:eukaryotic-like serine/threonine-protein kinase